MKPLYLLCFFKRGGGGGLCSTAHPGGHGLATQNMIKLLKRNVQCWVTRDPVAAGTPGVVTSAIML